MPPQHHLPPRGSDIDLFGPPSAKPEATADGAADADDPIEDAGTPSTAPDWQLDLFRHSPAEIAAHGARQALLTHSVEQAHEHLAALRPLPAYARFVTDCAACIELIERRDPRWQDVAQAVTWIESELAAAAERCVPGEAMQLLRPALHALLQAAPPASDTTRPHRAHPAYLWQLLGEPAQALVAIEADARWRSQPASLAWHGEICEQAGLHQRATVDVVELCLSWPAEAELWLASSAAWMARWNAWCELDDALPMHAFPAWTRLLHTGEIPMPEAGDARPGASLLRRADRLARAPSDLALRKALQRQCPALLSAYLAARRMHRV